VSPVRYELGFYIQEDAILRSHRCENLKSYTMCMHCEWNKLESDSIVLQNSLFFFSLRPGFGQFRPNCCQLCINLELTEHFMEPGGSLPCSQEPSISSYPESNQSSTYRPILLSKINIEASRLLNVNNITRRLKRKKPFQLVKR
jgi:hypothetical protein